MSVALEIVGRQSSHYTRMVRILAEELALAYRFTPIFDLMSRDADVFAGNPALKLPILRRGDDCVYGSLNICRVLSHAAPDRPCLVWPDEANALLLNAHEILAHAMSAEVDVVLHEIVEKRPPDTTSCKRRESLIGCLEWLDAHLQQIRDTLPAGGINVFEIGLFCLISHLPFRNPLDLSAMPSLLAFEREFAVRESAGATPYLFDVPQQV